MSISRRLTMSQEEPFKELRNDKLNMLYEKKRKTLFGVYLHHKGKVEECELMYALKFQKKEHIALGTVAVKEKYLNNYQLRTLLNYQREKGGLFGEIAIKLLFLNNKDVKNLLEKQEEAYKLLEEHKGKNIRIGDILVLIGAINRKDMEEKLKQFHKLVESTVETEIVELKG